MALSSSGSDTPDTDIEVALKMIKPGLAIAALLKRFEQEAHALGRLRHPGIAQVYEAGMADAGHGPQARTPRAGAQ